MKNFLNQINWHILSIKTTKKTNNLYNQFTVFISYYYYIKNKQFTLCIGLLHHFNTSIHYITLLHQLEIRM